MRWQAVRKNGFAILRMYVCVWFLLQIRNKDSNIWGKRIIYHLFPDLELTVEPSTYYLFTPSYSLLQ